MNDEVDIMPLIDTGYVREVIQDGKNAVFKNGRLVYIILDIDKPGKYFFDLRSVFNASTGEGGKDLKIMFMNNAVPWQLNGKTIAIHGWYPSGVDFHVTGAENQANSSLIDFNFPLGLFQEAGIYKFQFEVNDESGNLATSHYCFFQVTQNATTMAFNWNNGVNPFDSDYTKWKNDVNQKYNDFLERLGTLSETADKLEKLMQSYIDKAQQYVDQAWQDKLNGENTWTGKQHFNGGLTASMLQGDNLKIDSSASLPQNTTFNSPVLSDVGNQLEKGLLVHTGSTIADAVKPRQDTKFLNGVTSNSSGNAYMGFDFYKRKDGVGVSIHANCKVPKTAVNKPIVQFSKNYGIDQTPFRLGDYVMKFDWSSNTLYCLGYMSDSNQGNEICQDIVTII